VIKNNAKEGLHLTSLAWRSGISLCNTLSVHSHTKKITQPIQSSTVCLVGQYGGLVGLAFGLFGVVEQSGGRTPH